MSKIMIKLNFKIASIVFLISILLFILYYINTKNSYDIRISIKEDNFSASNMDNIFAKNLNEKLLKIKNIKKCTTISSINYCNVYLKLDFFSNKNSTIQEIKIAIDDYVSKIKINPQIDFDFEYNTIYDFFLIVYNEKNFNLDLIEDFDKILCKLLNSKAIAKILDYQIDDLTNYIYFDNSTLINYNITPTEIKNIIQKNNILKDSTIEQKNYLYFVNCKSNIKDIDDIKNMEIYYQDKNFSNKFKNIFKIKESLFEYRVIFNNKNARLLALSKNKFLPDFIFIYLTKNNLKNILLNDSTKYKIINTKKLSKTEIQIDNHTNLKDMYDLIELISNNFKNQIYFLNCDSPNISINDTYREINNNKITVLTKEKYSLENFLRKNKIDFNIKKNNSKKENFIIYKFNPSDMNSYFLDKNEVIESLSANYDGLLCDYYFNNSKRTKIILKNTRENDFIYSKKFKSFIDVNSFSKKETEKYYTTIVRNNGKKI